MKSVLLFFLPFYSIFGFAINPKADYIATPNKFNIKYKEVNIENNNVKICVWISEPKEEDTVKKEKAKTVLLVYGDYGNMSYYVSYISFYTKLGFRVISFDYRGFGKSSPFNIDPKRLFYDEFAMDMKNVMRYCKRDLKIKNIGIVALSMGTILAPIVLQEEKAEFIIAEGCVYNIKSVIERLRQIRQKEIIVNEEYELPKQWNNIKSKILIFVANDDKVTNLEDAQEIVFQNASKRNLIMYEGDHLSMLDDRKNLENYKKEIILFVNGN